jgi:acetyltransferase-like isoleucine patch superfamily enzyme
MAASNHRSPYDLAVAARMPLPVKTPPAPAVPVAVRSGPPPLRGGPLTFLRFAVRHRMLRPGYALLIARWLWLKLRWRGRLKTDGLCFVCPRVKFEIGPGATVHLGRWSWIGHGTKVRAHEGEVLIGAKSVLGQECTISAYQHVSIGRECIIADRVMMIDFDHGMVEVERPIRTQGIYKRDVDIGHNVWIGYGACVLRGVSVGDNSVIGTSSVVTGNVPDNAVVGGIPARPIRMREAPKTFRWG